MAFVHPGTKAAADVTHIGQTHLLDRLSGQCGTPTALAVEDETLPAAEQFLVIGAVGIDPELQHAAGGVVRAWNLALPVQFPDIADIDELHFLAAEQLTRLSGGEGFDLRFRLLEQGFVNRSSTSRTECLPVIEGDVIPRLNPASHTGKAPEWSLATGKGQLRYSPNNLAFLKTAI